MNRLTKYYVHHGTAKKQWDYETNMTHMRRNITLDMRMKAACKPHTEMDRTQVVKNIQMAGAAINSDILVNLALHEPRTFKVTFRFRFSQGWMKLFPKPKGQTNRLVMKIIFCITNANLSFYPTTFSHNKDNYKDNN